MLSEKKYYDAFVDDDKHVEINVLKSKDLVKQHVRYSHFVFHLRRGVTRKVRTVPNLVAENLGCIGPYISAIAAYRDATERKLKIGMGVRELEKFMTCVRKDKRTGKKVPRVVPIVVHLVGNIQWSNAVKWSDGHGNQDVFGSSIDTITSSVRAQLLHRIWCACFAT